MIIKNFKITFDMKVLVKLLSMYNEISYGLVHAI